MVDLFTKDGPPDEARDQLGRWTAGAGKLAAKVREAASTHGGTVVGAAVSAIPGLPGEVSDLAGQHIAEASRYVARRVMQSPAWRQVATIARKGKEVKKGTDMTVLTQNKLTQIQKMVEEAFQEDTEQLIAIGKSFDGLREGMRKGDEVTWDDLTDILGDVVIEKAVTAAAQPAATDEGSDDPLAPVFFDLYKQLFEDDGSIRKSLDPAMTQELFNKAYNTALGHLDTSIEAAAQATAIELGKSVDDVDITKARRRPQDDPGLGDEDCDDMEKLLKGMGVPTGIVKQIGQLKGEVADLKKERDMEGFKKQAEDMGEGAAFAAELYQLHEASPKLAEAITKRLAGKNALLKQNSAWSAEIGGGAANGESPNAYDKLSGYANEIVSKGQPDANGRKMTFAKAFAQACTDHPEAYAEYRAEQDGRRR